MLSGMQRKRLGDQGNQKQLQCWMMLQLLLLRSDNNGQASTITRGDGWGWMAPQCVWLSSTWLTCATYH
jgi:hypothetical protein